jgi:hypothetical protein
MTELVHWPEQILVPLDSQIRTPFIDIWNGIIEFDHLVETIRTLAGFPISGRLEWDIYLIGTSDLKRDIFSDTIISSSVKTDVLTESLPRFMWRAVGTQKNARKFDFLFDATDLRQGHQLVRTISCDSALENAVAQEFAIFDYAPHLEHKITKMIVRSYSLTEQG